jgi:hypothetical protein
MQLTLYVYMLVWWLKKKLALSHKVKLFIVKPSIPLHVGTVLITMR